MRALLNPLQFAHQPQLGVDDAVIYLLQRVHSHLDSGGGFAVITTDTGNLSCHKPLLYTITHCCCDKIISQSGIDEIILSIYHKKLHSFPVSDQMCCKDRRSWRMSDCLRCQRSHRWGHIPHMRRQRCVDKMTFAVPSAASWTLALTHCPGKTGYTQTSRSHGYVKKMFYDCCQRWQVTK